MTPERYALINQLFQDALSLAPGERAVFLQQASAGDEDLRKRAERLLTAHEQAEGFLEPASTAKLQDAVKRLLQDQEKTNGLPTPAEAQAVSETETDPLSGQQIGHYEIIRRIGAGGMGEVYLARDFALDRQVALKILPLEFTRDPDRLHRFAREAKAASALNHPNIITIYEIGVAQTDAGDLHFIATEFIEGETLRQRSKDQPLSLTEALDVAIQTAAALNAAHQAGIIHRDIKPENLMLRPDGYLKVLDFGLARINKTTAAPGDDSTTRRFLETHPGVVMGTLAYMSPEQARGERVDGRTDLWSLGVVLYELLTGMRPFTAATLPDLMVALLDREPAPLTQYLPHASLELTAVIRKALSKDTATRFQTAQEFGQALKELRRQADAVVPAIPSRDQTEHLSQAPTRTFAKQPTTSVLEEAETLPAVPKATLAPPLPSTTQPAKPERRWRVWLPLALALALVAGWAGWRWSAGFPVKESAADSTRVPEAPERSLSYSLTYQKVENGPEFEATGSEVFERNWKFQFTFSSPQTGYVYVFNEDPAEDGKLRYNKLFPKSGASARLVAGVPLRTDKNGFFGQPKIEKVWLVWAKDTVELLDVITDTVITNPAQVDSVRNYLAQHAANSAETSLAPSILQSPLRGRADVLVKAILLKRK